jgi:hypothetical protein
LSREEKMVDTNTDGAKCGLRRRDFWVNVLNADAYISGANFYTDYATVGSVVSTSVSATYSSLGTAAINDSYRIIQNGKGDYINHLRAEAIISGGMWVVGSAAVATPTNIVLKPAPLSALIYPLGVCVNTCQSGAVALIYTKGVYNGVTNLIAEDTIAAGAPFCVGKGAAGNCAIAWTTGSVARGTAIVGAGSEGVITALLW